MGGILSLLKPLAFVIVFYALSSNIAFYVVVFLRFLFVLLTHSLYIIYVLCISKSRIRYNDMFKIDFLEFFLYENNYELIYYLYSSTIQK